MNHIYAKKVFEILGTTQSPSEHRDKFPQFMNMYLRVAERKKQVQQFKEEILAFFNKYEQSLSFRIDQDPWDHFYTFDRIEPQELEHEIRDTLTDCLICQELYEIQISDSNSIGKVYISKENLNSLCDSFFTVTELEVFNSVEFYEKTLLEENISKKKTGKKIIKV